MGLITPSSLSGALRSTQAVLCNCAVPFERSVGSPAPYLRHFFDFQTRPPPAGRPTAVPPPKKKEKKNQQSHLPVPVCACHPVCVLPLRLPIHAPGTKVLVRPLGGTGGHFASSMKPRRSCWPCNPSTPQSKSRRRCTFLQKSLPYWSVFLRTAAEVTCEGPCLVLKLTICLDFGLGSITTWLRKNRPHLKSNNNHLRPPAMGPAILAGTIVKD